MSIYHIPGSALGAGYTQMSEVAIHCSGAHNVLGDTLRRRALPRGVMHARTEKLIVMVMQCPDLPVWQRRKLPFDQRDLGYFMKLIWTKLETTEAKWREDSAFSLKTWVFTWLYCFPAVWLSSSSSKSLGLGFVTCKMGIIILLQERLGDWKRKEMIKSQVKEFSSSSSSSSVLISTILADAVCESIWETL